jgi:opacity protein-like surface antigen
MMSQRALLVLVSAFALSVAAVAASPLRAGADEPSGAPVEFEPLPEETEPPPPPHDFTRDGWYVQAQGIYALENFGKTGNYSTLGLEVDNTFGFNVEAGYRVAQLFALGAEFEWTHAFESDDDELRIGTYNVGIPFRLYPLARLFDPGSMANRFQPFIKLSPTWMWGERERGDHQDSGKGGFVGRMGGGLDVYITDHFVFVTSALYNWPTANIDSLGYWSFGAGLQYRFGSGGSGY